MRATSDQEPAADVPVADAGRLRPAPLLRALGALLAVALAAGAAVGTVRVLEGLTAPGRPLVAADLSR